MILATLRVGLDCAVHTNLNQTNPSLAVPKAPVCLEKTSRVSLVLVVTLVPISEANVSQSVPMWS